MLKILHLSKREREEFFLINLVFKTDDDSILAWCKQDLEDFKKEISIKNIDAYKEFNSNLFSECHPFTDETIVKYFTTNNPYEEVVDVLNIDSWLSYNKKFDVYSFREYICLNEITLSAFKQLLNNADVYNFVRLVETLKLWWH